MLPRKRVTINLAPADLPKAGSGFDLAIAAAILVAGGETSITVNATMAFIGELGLDGSVKPVRGIIGRLIAGRQKGITDYCIPAGNLDQAGMVPGIKLWPIDSLARLYNLLNGHEGRAGLQGSASMQPAKVLEPQSGLSEICGQARAKRALLVAAAGGHNILLSGPPGTGKSMLAKALQGILPPLSQEEILEVTQLHSLSGNEYEQLVQRRPFRSPHHTASYAAMVGGGSSLKPGEISLAHRGVLFLDEMPEFKRSALEALRLPLEDKHIRLSRSNQSVEYPANFILAATANPCPCGFYGSGKACDCQPYQITRYRQRLSGPVLDRIDICAEVNDIDYGKLLSAGNDPDEDQMGTKSVLKARQAQAARFKDVFTLNSDMSNADIRKVCKLERAAKSFLDDAAGKLKLSARAYIRSLKVARTIADLDSSDTIQTVHIGEALAYRQQSV